MKKHFFFLLCIVAILLTFTGCGTQKVEEKDVAIKFEEPKVQENQQPSIQKEIEIIEEPDEIEEVEEVIEVTKTIEIPSQEDYWNLNYFNLYQYLTDCGLSDIEESNIGLAPENLVIIAHYNDWIFEISTAAQNQYANLYIHNEDSDIIGFYRDFDYTNKKTNIIIAVNNQADMVHQVTIEALADAISEVINFENTSHEPGEKPQIENFIYPE